MSITATAESRRIAEFLRGRGEHTAAKALEEEYPAELAIRTISSMISEEGFYVVDKHGEADEVPPKDFDRLAREIWKRLQALRGGPS